MRIQKNDHAAGDGILYLIPTPIGNLEDMTFRAIRLMKEADVIAAEDTRNTKKLCHYFEIDTPLVSYHEHNRETSGRRLVERLIKGDKVALVSDAGTPCISDPGFELVRAAIEAGIPVVPLPGANAAITALIASGINPQPFYFYGFLPRGKKEKKEALERLKYQDGALLIYEAPHRLKETLQLMLDVWGNRKMALSRELTKKFEEFIRGTIREALDWAKREDIRGEFCLVVEGSRETKQEESPWWAPLSVREHVDKYIKEQDMPAKEAIKLAAKERGLPKREVYQAYHVNGQS
jgi:16S rRNA (cytidine1402-2'-O)-methyltransferase